MTTNSALLVLIRGLNNEYDELVPSVAVSAVTFNQSNNESQKLQVAKMNSAVQKNKKNNRKLKINGESSGRDSGSSIEDQRDIAKDQSASMEGYAGEIWKAPSGL